LTADRQPGRERVVVRTTGLAKSFGPTRAVKDANLELRPGEVHAVVGENGSGKSTLVKLLSGVHRPDAGTIELDGAGVRFATPSAALEAGIATVFQEVLVAGARTVLENLWAGGDGIMRSRIPRKRRVAKAREILANLLPAPPPLDTPAEQLPLAVRQVCAIARSLLRAPQLLILDEATSALDVDTTTRLFAYLAGFKAAGGSVLFTSHRMDEIAAVSDRVTVVRDGRTVATLEAPDSSSRALIHLMAGRDRAEPEPGERPYRRSTRGPDLLRVRGLRLAPGKAGVEFTLRSGEFVGLAGLEGHGQDAFLASLWGSARVGELCLVNDDRESAIRSPRDATRHGIGYVPRDRRDDALFPTQSVLDNFAVTTLSHDRHLGVVRRSRTMLRFARYAGALDIRARRVTDDISTLSGGNQQKVVIARWLAIEPKVLLLNDPTRGVDVNVKHDLYRLLTALAADGLAIVMLSTELDEHMALADRVLVFREHELAEELTRAELSREAVVAAMFGRTLERAHA
jgi:ABC-type sugar transport system ATPase subunit